MPSFHCDFHLSAPFFIACLARQHVCSIPLQPADEKADCWSITGVPHKLGLLQYTAPYSTEAVFQLCFRDEGNLLRSCAEELVTAFKHSNINHEESILAPPLRAAKCQGPAALRVDKHSWGNVRLVQANLVLLNHHWQEPVSHPALSDAAITPQASDPACLLSIPPSSPGLSTHPCSLGFMLLRPFICIYLLLF